MNTVSAIKLVSFLSRLALVGVAALILGVTLDVQPLACFAASASILVLLVVAGDYAPRTSAPAQTPVADIIPFAPAPAPAKRAA